MKEKILTTIGTATLILGACSESAINKTRKPNIVYVFADQWRASAFGYAGDPNIQTPETIEGEDLSDLIHNNRELPDRSVIYMSVAPILRQTEAHRSVRTNRYTYVRNLEGPKYLFDNKQDPWQMHNMIEKPEYASLQKQMEEKLQAHLQRIGDKFLHPKSYIEKWGYELDMSGAISYNTSAKNFKVQSPLRKKDL